MERNYHSPRNYHPLKKLIASSLLLSALGFGSCEKKGQNAAPPPPAPTPAAQPAPTTLTAYTPPSADQLYQMVAPIALFPDKLVALVLAGATYPDQITAANTWLAQYPNLKGQALATASGQQQWDPSIKALTSFPAVLSQMASNAAWTTALGQAYYHDPNDVLNAIQVMRSRAQASGHLRSGDRIRVTQVPKASAPADRAPEGPVAVPPPPETIVIEPAQPDVVYVPDYDVSVVYGEPVAVYPGYVYHPWAYTSADVLTTGVIAFGAGVAVSAAFGHVGWGWNAWDMHWGGPPPGGGGWQPPAVTYNHATYVSNSTTVINWINNVRVTNNVPGPRNHAPMPVPGRMPPVPANGVHPPKPMTMPHFSANDARPGALPSAHSARPNAHPPKPQSIAHDAANHVHAEPRPAPSRVDTLKPTEDRRPSVADEHPTKATPMPHPVQQGVGGHSEHHAPRASGAHSHEAASHTAPSSHPPEPPRKPPRDERHEHNG